jgi:hypothetical protein
MRPMRPALTLLNDSLRKTLIVGCVCGVESVTMERDNGRADFVSGLLFGDSEIVLALEIEPEFRASAKPSAET